MTEVRRSSRPPAASPANPSRPGTHLGRAPASNNASRTARDGLPAISRPLCPYPSEARYNGSGDPAQAANFSCKVVAG